MPLIKDYSISEVSGTTAYGIVVDVPPNIAGDLILILAVCDTNTTWTTPSGYSLLFDNYNFCDVACFYKISSGSESATLSIEATTLDTYNATTFVIEDVDQSYPLGNPPVFAFANRANVTSSVRTIPSITTTRDNTLCITFAARTGVNNAVFCEGLARTVEDHVSGGESLTTGWFVQRTSGTVPDTSVSYVGTSGGGIEGMIMINPPSTGATKMPAYVTTDNSVFLNPIIVSSYTNVSTASTTVDTNFGLIIDGNDVVDASTSTGYSLGINPQWGSYLISQIPSVKYRFAGVEFIFTTPVDMSTMPLLVHVYPSTGGVAKALAELEHGGISLGVRSNTGTDWKVWSVLGNDSQAVSFERYFPAVIDVADNNYLDSSGTLTTDSIQAFAVLSSFSATGTVTLSIIATGLWLISSTTFAGGSASSSFSFEDIFDGIFNGKFRKSIYKQGKRQYIAYQPFVIGSGVAGSTYFDADATSLEFPQRRNVQEGQGLFNVSDNWVGLLYNPGDGDVIRHRNSVVSSPSRFHWGLHANASTSATYDFTRLTVIGAGTVTLNKTITVGQLVLKDYSTLDISNVTLNGCTIADTPTISDSVVVNNTTTLTECTIDVSRISSGNYWLSISDPSVISDCSFTGGGGHAIRLTATGTYSFSGNTFTGFDIDGTDNAAILNDSGGSITINISGGGDTPTVKNGTGASTIIQNSVNIVLDNIVIGSSYYVFETNNPTNVYGSGTASSSIVTIDTPYVSDTLITVRVRNASGVIKYKNFSTNTLLDTGGANVYVTQEIDTIA